ncbi:MAG: MG2 domain-containing protein, partial [Pyrinomonadaceae bacterium]|nr:MG2 domain-containing protein [Pyrinomonadaceae bacterium]
MWRMFFVWLLVCQISVFAQNVVENETSIIINEKTADVNLTVDNQNKNSAQKISLELIANNGILQSQTVVSQQIKQGKDVYKLQLPIENLSENDKKNIVWFRLKYQIGDSRGTISLSQIVQNIFEIRVISSDLLLAGMTYRNRIYATNPFTQKAVESVKINAILDLELKDEKKLQLNSNGETDNQGFADLEFQIPNEVSLNDAELKIIGKKNGIVREAKEDLSTQNESYSFPIMTDKPIYQPEQMLNVRGILLKGLVGKYVVPNTEVEFRVEDEEETVLYREKTKTSEFGVASISWKIPDNAKLGRYQITAKIEGDTIAYQSIKVSRYDLPNFAVNAKALKSYYLPNEKQAEVEVNADYLFGKPVTKGKVRVVRETERTWNYKEQKYDIEEGESHEGKTDETGKFTAKFDLAKDFENLKDSDYKKFDDLNFTAYFTDLTTNRTEQRRFDVRLTKEPIHVYFIGERDNLNA